MRRRPREAHIPTRHAHEGSQNTALPLESANTHSNKSTAFPDPRRSRNPAEAREPVRSQNAQAESAPRPKKTPQPAQGRLPGPKTVFQDPPARPAFRLDAFQ